MLCYVVDYLLTIKPRAHLCPSFVSGLHCLFGKWEEELELKRKGEKDGARKGMSGQKCRQKQGREGGDGEGVTFTVILAESQVSSVRQNNMG